MRLIYGSILWVSILLLGLIACQPAEPSPPQLLYLRASDTKSDLWRQSITASTPGQQLTDTPYGIWDFTPSADGRWILYSRRDEDGSDDLWLLNVAAGDETLLLDCHQVACRYGQWQPDGTLIAFERYSTARGSQTAEVWLLDSSNGESWPAHAGLSLTEGGPETLLSQFPRWSADGRFLSYYKPDLHLVVGIDLQDETDEPYLWPVVLGDMGGWSPNSYQLAYTGFVFAAPDLDHSHADESGQPLPLYTHLHLIDLMKEEIIDLHPAGEQHDGRPVWHPDGKRLYFPRGIGLEKDIWQYEIESGAAQELVNAPAVNHSALAWSPDGRYLAFMRFGQPSAIWMYDQVSGEERLLSSEGFLPQWLP